MKVDVSIPVDDLPALREALADYSLKVEARLRHSVGYPGESVWRAKLEASERLIRAVAEHGGGR